MPEKTNIGKRKRARWGVRGATPSASPTLLVLDPSPSLPPNSLSFPKSFLAAPAPNSLPKSIEPCSLTLQLHGLPHGQRSQIRGVHTGKMCHQAGRQLRAIDGAAAPVLTKTVVVVYSGGGNREGDG